ncbi:hypothetical protein LA080_004495 [Diaporthe eres]|nr:hypothetical protein LA080_004495 [Diaporthe eres]
MSGHVTVRIEYRSDTACALTIKKLFHSIPIVEEKLPNYTESVVLQRFRLVLFDAKIPRFITVTCRKTAFRYLKMLSTAHVSTGACQGHRPRYAGAKALCYGLQGCSCKSQSKCRTDEASQSKTKLRTKYSTYGDDALETQETLSSNRAVTWKLSKVCHMPYCLQQDRICHPFVELVTGDLPCAMDAIHNHHIIQPVCSKGDKGYLEK